MKQKADAPEKQLARMVGSLIANQRKQKGLTQAQLAEYMDVEKETVSRIETGVISPTLGRLAQFAKFLDCDITDLLRAETVAQTLDPAKVLSKRMENLSDSQQMVLIQVFGRVATALEKMSLKDRKIVERFISEIL